MGVNVKQLDSVEMQVRDLARTAAWYRRVFGFEVVARDDDRHAILLGGDAVLRISQHADPAPRARFGLRITDRAAWERTIERERLELRAGPVRGQYATSWVVADPDGTELEIVSWDFDQIVFHPSQVRTA